LTINLVSLNEQQRLVDILNENEVQYYKQLSLMSELKKKAEALKKSILKQAFSGYKLLEDVS
jgi:restriction endonuclease S subunit